MIFCDKNNRDVALEILQEKYGNSIPDGLEIGCGDNPQAGYVHTEMYITEQNIHKVDINCSAKDLPFADESFTSVLLFGVFEHFGYFEVQKVLLEVSRVLKKGGIFRFDVPDFDWFIHAYLTGNDKNTNLPLDPIRNEAWVMHAIFGGQDGPGMTHQWGWNEKRLRAFLEKPNWEFSEIRLVGRQWRDPESNHLIWDCLK